MDVLTKAQRSYLMSCVHPKNSKIEREIFSRLKKTGLYFQRHYKKAPGTPDIALPLSHKAVFIHSDFWHGWQYPRWSKKLSNDFWREKISCNRRRDRLINSRLRSKGWQVLVIWEHSYKADPDKVIRRIFRFLRS